MSARDFNGRLLEPVIARPRRPLSSNASTDSCNIRFSLRTMMSGAFSSNNRFKRLLRLITRRYRSFKSDVAKRPPSSGTKGRKSGGNTGKTSKIIHSGLLPDFRKASINLSRLESFLIFVSELVLGISSRNSDTNSSRSIEVNKPCTASAPILAENSSPNSSIASKYCSSLSN